MIILRTKRFSLASRGIRFIKELKKIDKIPINEEEFGLLILPFEPSSLGPKIVKSLELDEIRAKINKYYKNNKAADIMFRVGFGYIKGKFDSWDKIFKLQRNEIKDIISEAYIHTEKLPLRYILDSIGAGVYGIAFNYPGGKVEKINFNDFSKRELQFYQYLKKNPIRVFPKIYTLEKDQVIMEKLNTDSPKLQKYRDWMKRYRISSHHNGNYNNPNEYSFDWELAEKELGKNHEFLVWVREIKNGLKDIFGLDTLGDFGRTNVGERISTGEIVFFDPIGGIIEMEN